MSDVPSAFPQELLAAVENLASPLETPSPICKPASHHHSRKTNTAAAPYHTMNAQMAAARHALPLSTPSSLMFLHSKTPTALAADDAKAAAVSTETRESTGAKLSRKMQQLLPGKKERQQKSTGTTATTEEDEKKRATWRRLVGSQALLHMGCR